MSSPLTDGSVENLSPRWPRSCHMPRLLCSQGRMAAEESSADTLRLQFKAMQELQHRRLQKHMEKKKEKELSCKGKADQEELAEIPDNLSLLDTEEQNLKTIFEKR